MSLDEGRQNMLKMFEKLRDDEIYHNNIENDDDK